MATPVLIAGAVGSSMSAATGRPGQGHLVYAANQAAWWLLYLTSTQSLSALYSSGFSSWTAPTGSPMSLTVAHASEGRNFGFACANIASTDVLHAVSSYASTILTYHTRFTLGTTWTSTNAETSDATAPGGTLSSCSGAVTALTSGNIPIDGSPWVASGHAIQTCNATSVDSGTSWTGGFTRNSTYGTGSFGASSYSLHSLGSNTYLEICDNALSNANAFTNLSWSVWGGSSFSPSTQTNVLGSSVTSASPNAWGSVGRTTSDIHAVALSNNSNAYVHARFNGTSWSAGDTVPTLTYGTNSGIFLATDGTNVWAHVLDGSGNVQQSQWTSGSGWSAWSQVATFRTAAGAYLSGCQQVQGGNIGLIWTEPNSANFDIVGALISTGGGGGGPTYMPWIFGDQIEANGIG